MFSFIHTYIVSKSPGGGFYAFSFTLSRRILKKSRYRRRFFLLRFLFGSVLSHFTCRALRKAAPVFSLLRRRHLFLPFRCPSSPLLPKTGGSPSRKREDSRRQCYIRRACRLNAWFAASPEENIIYLTFDCGYETATHQRFLMRSRSIRLPRRSLSSAIFSPTSRILSNVWQQKAISSETTPGRTRICPKSPRRKPSQKN